MKKYHIELTESEAITLAEIDLSETHKGTRGELCSRIN